MPPHKSVYDDNANTNVDVSHLKALGKVEGPLPSDVRRSSSAKKILLIYLFIPDHFGSDTGTGVGNTRGVTQCSCF